MSSNTEERDEQSQDTLGDAALRTAKCAGMGIIIGSLIAGPVGAVIGGIWGTQAGVAYSCAKNGSSDEGSGGNDTCN